jgi:hypothetical protein
MNSQLKKIWDWFTLSPAKKAQLDWEEIRKNATIHRTTPSGERRVFRVPVTGKYNASDILEAFQAARQKEPLVDPVTGDEDTDLFMPVSEENKTIKTLLHLPTDYTPKMNSRYLVEFPEFMNIDPAQVVSADKPSFHNYHGEDILRAQTFVINDLVSKRTAETLAAWANVGNKRTTPDITILDLDPTGHWVDKYTMKNCELTELNFGQVSFASETIQTITLMMKPTNFIVERFMKPIKFKKDYYF